MALSLIMSLGLNRIKCLARKNASFELNCSRYKNFAFECSDGNLLRVVESQLLHDGDAAGLVAASEVVPGKRTARL